MIARTHLNAPIANGASLSDAVDLINYDFVALMIPAIDGTAITFQSSEDGVTYNNVHDSAGTEVSYTVASNRYVLVNTAHLGQFGRFIKVRTGSAGTPTNQTAARVIQVIGRSIT